MLAALLALALLCPDSTSVRVPPPEVTLTVIELREWNTEVNTICNMRFASQPEVHEICINAILPDDTPLSSAKKEWTDVITHGVAGLTSAIDAEENVNWVPTENRLQSILPEGSTISGWFFMSRPCDHSGIIGFNIACDGAVARYRFRATW